MRWTGPSAVLVAALLGGCLAPTDGGGEAPSAGTIEPSPPPADGPDASVARAPRRFALDEGSSEAFAWHGETWRLAFDVGPRFTLRAPDGVAHVIELREGERVVTLRLPDGEREASAEPRNARVSFLGDAMSLHARPAAQLDDPEAWRSHRVDVEVVDATAPTRSVT